MIDVKGIEKHIEQLSSKSDILRLKIDKLEDINRQNDMLINSLQTEQVRLNQVIADLKKKIEIYE